MSGKFHGKPPAKKKYEKAVLRSFPLVAEEVMVSGCKTSGSSAPGASPLGQPTCVTVPCTDAGS